MLAVTAAGAGVRRQHARARPSAADGARSRSGWRSDTRGRTSPLAHVVPNKVEAAYARSDLFERRRLLMDDWAEYVRGTAADSTRR